LQQEVERAKTNLISGDV